MISMGTKYSLALPRLLYTSMTHLWNGSSDWLIIFFRVSDQEWHIKQRTTELSLLWYFCYFTILFYTEQSPLLLFSCAKRLRDQNTAFVYPPISNVCCSSHQCPPRPQDPPHEMYVEQLLAGGQQNLHSQVGVTGSDGQVLGSQESEWRWLREWKAWSQENGK